MKKGILVFIAFLGTAYSFYSTSFEKKVLKPVVQQNTKITKKIIHYKDISIHTPVIKDFDNLEIIGIDRKSMPVVYYRYENSVKKASLDDTIESSLRIEKIGDKSVILRDLSTSQTMEYSIK
ncbi:MAG: hypothetical protein ACOCWO_05220 [Candidatus Muiribacteriaceae bacterium]